MLFRAVVQDGFIVINTRGSVPDGTHVDVTIVKKPSNTKRAPSLQTSSRTSRAGKSSSPKHVRSKRASSILKIPGLGMWRDRTELGSSEEATAALRKLTRRDRGA